MIAVSISGRGVYGLNLDLVLLNKAPSYTKTECAALCLSNEACLSFAFQERLQTDSNPNACITYVQSHTISPPPFFILFISKTM